MTPHFRILPNITLEGARRIRDRAFAQAVDKGLSIALVIIDRMGILVLAETMDDAPPGSSETAMMKAKGAARYRAPTHDTAEFVKTLPVQLASQALSLPDLCAMQGGMPISADKKVVGGIGISGGSGAEDIEIARQAVKAVT